MVADLLLARACQGCLLLQGSRVVQAPLNAAGREWLVTCASMGNPHAVIYSMADGASIRVMPSAIPPCDLWQMPCIHPGKNAGDGQPGSVSLSCQGISTCSTASIVWRAWGLCSCCRLMTWTLQALALSLRSILSFQPKSTQSSLRYARQPSCLERTSTAALRLLDITRITLLSMNPS